MRLNWLLAIVVGGPLLGCGGDSSQELAALEAQVVDVSAMTFTSNATPALDLRVDDADRAQAAYAATLALPTMPGGIYHCPIDFGVDYHVVFLDGKGGIVLATDVDPNGCQTVTLSGTSIPSRWAAEAAAYWQQLATSLSIDETQIYPHLPSSS